ncbi:sugar-binding transcriptional regulator [Pseudomonas putida]|uniref:sugar-binding transcriptional regulator n=1 Tax=Pseudomonas putida TaxID=303 RepID=UPI002FBD49FE
MSTANKQDLMAKVAWLYFVGNKTQQEIAQSLNISRPTINRMISQATDSGLVQVRISHSTRDCLELAETLQRRYDLSLCEVAPTLDGGENGDYRSIAALGGAVMERYLSDSRLAVIAVGFGRTLKAVVEGVSEIPAPHLKILSLAGSVALDGSFNNFDVGLRLADKTGSKAFLLPMPVIAPSTEERDHWHNGQLFPLVKQLYKEAEVAFVGIGDVLENCALVADGFISAEEALSLQSKGAVGEILGWAMNKHGERVNDGWAERVTSFPLESLAKRPIIAFAGGERKIPAILAALRGRWISGLVTDEATAVRLAAL